MMRCRVCKQEMMFIDGIFEILGNVCSSECMNKEVGKEGNVLSFKDGDTK